MHLALVTLPSIKLDLQVRRLSILMRLPLFDHRSSQATLVATWLSVLLFLERLASGQLL